MSKLLNISEASELLGVSKSTLRRWENEGKLIPDERTAGGQRRYKLSSIKPQIARNINLVKKTLGYARVSSHDQKVDLIRQKEVIELYCSAQGWSFEVIDDLGSGMNYNKKGLRRLLNEILSGEVGRLVITHKDRLLRFGAELVFAICEIQNIEVVIINQGGETSFEEELTKDVLEIITVFSARLYGSRSRKNKKLIENLKEAVDEI
jgi:excisionase family DNA binding protein